MKASGPGISLKQQGMKADSLECPEGGRHAVSEAALAVAKARGAGAVTCIKCGSSVGISRL
jgi:transcription elongation factor Elf1